MSAGIRRFWEPEDDETKRSDQYESPGWPPMPRNKGTEYDVYQQTMEAWNETRKRVVSYLVKTGAVFMRWRQADWTSWDGKK